MKVVRVTAKQPLFPNGDTPEVCCHLHPENRRRCQLFLGHDDLAHSWERYSAAGEVVESYEWIGDGDG